ncbi:MAG: serine hydrolase domain-containing protein [Lysobacterales bacterium]|jgi:CubicO group peptidase (beta-lactamase class C family)
MLKDKRAARCRASLLLLLITALVSVQSAAAERPAWADRVDQKVQEVKAAKGIPGISLAIVRDGKLAYTGAWGLADVEMGLPAKPETVYPISSVSKIFTGPVAMALVAEGKLDLDTSVLHYLPQLPKAYRPITMRHLLSHTHGLTDYYHTAEFDALPDKVKYGMSGDELILWLAPRPFEFQPGKGWSYNLLGYVMAQRILEAIEYKPFADIVTERIFKPLGMNASVYGGTGIVIPGRHPVLYGYDDAHRLTSIPLHFPAPTYAAGGLNSSVLDMARYFAAIENNELLTPEAFAEIWKPYPVSAEGLKPGQAPFYGLGWFSVHRKSTGRFVVGHEGGGNAWAYYWPDYHLAVIALSNLSGARADLLDFDIAQIIIGESTGKDVTGPEDVTGSE